VVIKLADWNDGWLVFTFKEQLLFDKIIPFAISGFI
jgi:hypothetical protein